MTRPEGRQRRVRHRQWDTVVDALKGIWLGLGDRRPLTAIPLECRA
jgi:hypothetical protein